MTMFIAIFEEDIPSHILERATDIYGDGMMQISDRVLLIRAYGADPAPISAVLNLSGESDSTLRGVVFNLYGSYSGRFYENLWQWLEETREKGLVRG